MLSDFLILAYLGVSFQSSSGQWLTISVLQFCQLVALSSLWSYSSAMRPWVTSFLFQMHQKITLRKSRQCSERSVRLRWFFLFLQTQSKAMMAAQKKYSTGLLSSLSLISEYTSRSKEPYFSSIFFCQLTFFSLFSSPFFNLVKYFNFSLNFRKILYSKVLSLPREATFHQTSFSFQFSGIGTVFCKYLSEMYSQYSLGFQTRKQITLPYSSSKMDEVATVSNRCKRALPKSMQSTYLPCRLFWQFLTMGSLYLSRNLKVSGGGRQVYCDLCSTRAQKKIVVSAYLTKCWKSGFPQYYPTSVLPVKSCFNSQIWSFLRVETSQNHVLAISAAKLYLSPSQALISAGSLAKSETFLDEMIHSSVVGKYPTCAFSPLALLSLQTWILAWCSMGSSQLQDRMFSIYEKMAQCISLALCSILLLLDQTMAFKDLSEISKNFMSPLLPQYTSFCCWLTITVLPLRTLFLQKGCLAQTSSSWGPLAAKLKSMMVSPLWTGCGFLTLLMDLSYLLSISLASAGFVKTSLNCPTVLNSFSRSFLLMGLRLSSFSISSSESAFISGYNLIKEQANKLFEIEQSEDC